jgi:hypothetical protein
LFYDFHVDAYNLILVVMSEESVSNGEAELFEEGILRLLQGATILTKEGRILQIRIDSR